MDKLFTGLGATLMFLGVAAGAFGAHGLRDYFAQHAGLESTYETAVRYQIYHALALFVVAWVSQKWPGTLANWAGYSFLLGILLFSGSLYVLVMTRIRWLGAITPLGGVAFLAGWLLIVILMWRAQ